MEEFPDWYDSRWLARYLQAKAIVEREAPARLASFVGAFAPLRTDPAFQPRFLPRMFDEVALDQLRAAVRAIPPAALEMDEMRLFGRFVVHDLTIFTELQHELADTVSELAGEPLEPSYNFLAMYSRLGVCDPHLDAPSAKWTLDICLDQSVKWPIHFSRTVGWPESPDELRAGSSSSVKARDDLAFAALALEPGDAILFSGSSQWHYRDPLADLGKKHFCDLLFLHYIPKGTAELVQPRNWARLFGLPQLATIPGIDEKL